MKTKLTLLLFVTIICISKPNITAAQVNVQDSLALVDLYNSTDGPNWKRNDNWLAGPVKKWYGIYMYSDGRVQVIDLRNNNLKGSIPPSLGNLTGLVSLLLLDNHLSGSIPPELGKLTNLVNLSFRINQLTGSIPPELGKLTNLVILSLRTNQLSGGIPSELGDLTKLQLLWLFDNKLSGNIPLKLGNLTNLIDLRLDNNQLDGSIPSALGNLASLQYLYLNSNQLSGNIPSELGNLANLSDLLLNNNELADSIPYALGNLHNLQYLYLNNNQLSSNIPSAMGKLANLKHLSLDSNQLSGQIPSSLGNLTNLLLLDLKNNRLKDSIPSSLGNLKNLKYLRLSHNKLSGNIPSSFSNLINLATLSAGDNILSGEVPSFLGTLPKLKSLNLLRNHYTFDGLEALVPNNNFDTLKYQRQRLLDLHETNNTLSVYAGGTLSNNTYKWFKDGALYASNTGDSTLQITESGAYNVEVTNAIATELTLYSDTINFNTLTTAQLNDIVAINATGKTNFSVYPNPAKTTATIAFNEIGNCVIKLTDVSGRVLQTKTVVANKEGNTLQLNVSNYAKGVYWITLTNDKNESRSIKLWKQ